MREKTLVEFTATAPGWLVVLVSAALGIIGGAFPVAPGDTPATPGDTWGFEVDFRSGLIIFLLSLLASALPRLIEAIRSLQEAQEETRRRLEQSRIEFNLFDKYRTLTESRTSSVFTPLADELLKETTDCLRAMGRGSYVLEAVVPPAEYAKRWRELMSSALGEGGNLQTVTNMVIWSSDFFGSDKNSYGDDNREMRESGRGNIERIFVIPPDQLLDKNDGRIRKELHEMFERYLQRTKALLTDKVFQTKSIHEYKKHFNPDSDWSHNLALWTFDQHQLCLQVAYRPRPGVPHLFSIQRIRFTTDAEAIRQAKSVLNLYGDPTRTIPLSEYLERLDGRASETRERLHEAPRRSLRRHHRQPREANASSPGGTAFAPPSPEPTKGAPA